MHTSTKKWLFTKISSLILIPLMIWFIISFLSIYDKDYSEITSFFSNQPSRILFSIFIVIAFFFSALTISEIFEDYLHNDKIKYVANKALYFSAIIIPLLTILGIYNLN
jgi:succinate dehydrogenase / fumarate reductase membrane anchor subunit